MIAKGRAREVLDLDPKLMPISGRYISTLMEEGEAKTARFPKTSTIGQFSSYFHGGANCVLPALRIEKREAKMAGGAIMRGDRLVGWLSDQEVKTLRWLNGTFTAGDEVIVKNGPEQERNVTTFEVRGARSSVKSEIRNGIPVFTLSIRGEGSLAEDGFDHKPSLRKLKEREKEISQNIKENAEKLIVKMQKKKVDIFGLYEEMRRHQHPYWKQHRIIGTKCFNMPTFTSMSSPIFAGSDSSSNDKVHDQHDSRENETGITSPFCQSCVPVHLAALVGGMVAEAQHQSRNQQNQRQIIRSEGFDKPDNQRKPHSPPPFLTSLVV